MPVSNVYCVMYQPDYKISLAFHHWSLILNQPCAEWDLWWQICHYQSSSAHENFNIFKPCWTLGLKSGREAIELNILCRPNLKCQNCFTGWTFNMLNVKMQCIDEISSIFEQGRVAGDKFNVLYHSYWP